MKHLESMLLHESICVLPPEKPFQEVGLVRMVEKSDGSGVCYACWSRLDQLAAALRDAVKKEN